ncbi:tyrosine-protein phosphatase [Nocardia puris]|uniref:Protein-tyrosine phosphatase n=1 Tax=Nocardia puris TaxID=208602 RepID=A0A366DRS4_9NOCA|nr:tyrosine-protein phosphatase [Nocardia puris]MBF6210920.1 tyrosine-protein phosphatase [Nocardia puris]MBF6364515.1 tyrosine-protein phosphatase [Nocardia puris]MBF6459444.1 tyrosine-protein phosphatase [Nocardia puris]RBO92595.1 protein-tyrosine phosphatase [Nocardia puris]
MTLTPPADTPPTDHFLVPGTFNFRDTGGLRTEDGATVRPGVLLRSAQLSGLDGDGHRVLRDLRVTDVFDLRGPAEIDHVGHDNLPGDVRLTITPFDTRMGETPPHDAQTSAARIHMIEVYRAFPTLPESHAAITAIARTLVDGEGAVLVHCAAGKDRTGWAVATLLRAVGVTEDEVFGDFLLSNHAVPALRAMIAPKLAAGANVSDDLLGVHPEYLRTALDAAVSHFGDFDSYLEAAGLTDPLRERLRERMLR